MQVPVEQGQQLYERAAAARGDVKLCIIEGDKLRHDSLLTEQQGWIMTTCLMRSS